MIHNETTLNGFGGLPLHAQQWRPEGAAKAALSIVHGFGEHSGRYGNVVQWFVPRGYAVYAFDLRGMGRSPGPRGHIQAWDELREDVHAFLTWVRSQEQDIPQFLLGHSQGGLIALDYALHRPQGLTGVIASGPALGALPVPSYMLALARILSSVWPRFTLDVKLDQTALSRDTSVGEAYAADPLVHNLATARMGVEMAKAIERVQSRAAEFQASCLIVHGGADRIVGPECSRVFCENLAIADKARIEYPGHYHELFNDIDRDSVLADVEAWVERHTAGTAPPL